MVASIRYWLKAFGLTDEYDQPNNFAEMLFGKFGKDPYIENIGTLWLLHYFLVKTNRASIYSLVFNEFRKERREFNQAQLERFINRKCVESNNTTSPKSIQRDINVFLKNYIRPRHSKKNIDENFSAILIDLGLIQELATADSGTGLWYAIASKDRPEIPPEIILFAILDQYSWEELPQNLSISFRDLLNGANSVGNIFAMTSRGLLDKIGEIVESNSTIVFSDDAGIKELQFKRPIDRWEILQEYYDTQT